MTGGALTGAVRRQRAERCDALDWGGLDSFCVQRCAQYQLAGRCNCGPAYDVVEKEFGKEKARALFIDNPMAAFEGRDLPHVPELEDERVQRPGNDFYFFRWARLTTRPVTSGRSSVAVIHEWSERQTQPRRSPIPRTSLTTSRASRVLRHQCCASNGSWDAARTIARPSPWVSERHSVRTRRVCGLVVTMMTVCSGAAFSAALMAMISSAVLRIGGSRTWMAAGGNPFVN